jgi:uncharacterized membrane protein
MKSSREKPTELTWTNVVYFLQALAFINGITAIIGVIINYVRLDDVRGTWLESHYRWQIQTFWYGLAMLIVGGILAVVIIGWFILAFAFFWFIYRIVKGWLRLSDGKWMVV